MTDKEYIEMLKKRDTAMPMDRYIPLGKGSGWDRCPVCGRGINLDSSQFCDRCGQRLDRENYQF